MNIQDRIKALNSGRTFYLPEEIKAAKRKLSLAKMMKMIGDGAFASESPVASPFHPSDRPTFRLYRDYRRVVFTCCGKCGYDGDQIDYLKMRFQLPTGQAIALFCNLAGIS